MSTFEDERRSYSRSPNEEVRMVSFARPLTGKKPDPEAHKVQKKYINRNNSGSKSKKNPRDRNSPLLVKLKPNKVLIEKERLYIENMELKIKNNELSEALTKYKSKVIQLERDRHRKSTSPNSEQFSQSNYLVKLLKKNIKELQFEVQRKDSEVSYKGIHYLREKIKNDSNSRMKIDKSPKHIDDIQKALRAVEALRQELKKKEKRIKEESEKLVQDLNDEKKSCSVLKFKLDEANTLIESLYKELRLTRQKNSSRFVPPRLLQALSTASKDLKKPIWDFLLSLDSENSLKIPTHHFLSHIRLFDNEIDQGDIDSIIEYIKTDKTSEISLKKLMNYYNTFDFEMVSRISALNQRKELFDHMVLRLQLHRVPKENLIESLITQSSKPLHNQEIVLLFTNAPFNFSRKEASIIVEYFFEGVKMMNYEEFIKKFYSCVEPWEVFTAKDEENFDAYLLNIITLYEEKLLEECMSQDPEDTGIIDFITFKSCLETFKINLPERIENYLLVLFYSHNMEIDRVPYKQFFQAYATQIDDRKSVSKEQISQRYIESLSKHLLSQHTTVRSVFKYDDNGIILAEDFISGLKSLNMPEIPKDDLLILLETLQDDPEERFLYVSIQNLEGILENYGVYVESCSESELESLAGTNEGHVQKVSLLDSAQLDLNSDQGTHD